MAKCEFCGEEVALPFQCSFCNGYFCIEHRLPENHSCPQVPRRTPLGPWKAKIRKIQPKELPSLQRGTRAEETPNCPKCASERTQTIAYRKDYIRYECLDCGLKWKVPKSEKLAYISKHMPQKSKRKRGYRIAVLSLCLLGVILSGLIIYTYGPQIMVWIKTRFPSLQPDQTAEVVCYQLIIDVVGSGVTHPSSGSYTYDEGTDVTVDAVPDSGWKLDHWELDGSNVGSASSQMVTMNANHTIIAVFDRAIEELVNYALSLINIDRTTHGLSNVSLSPIESAQEHAEDMLEHNYFSHWDTNGYKPYMRYTLAGGKGAVTENIAWQYSSGSLDVKEAIKNLEWSMVYDDAESNWGHRDNILDPFHNRISIGIAYDNHNVYYVQDFEDNYIEWSTFMNIDDGEVTLSGSFGIRQLSIESINIFYDPLPTNLTSDQLNSFYSGGYSQGTFVGMALPPNYESVEGITITAQTWIQTDNNFQIRFDLSQAFNVYGRGVYTLYLQSDSDSYHYLTSYSFWYK